MIQGRMKLQQENLRWHMTALRQLVTAMSEPQRRKGLWDDQKEFWSVDFTATPAQWKSLQPELEKMQVEVNLLESPDLIVQSERAEERALERIGKKNKYQFVWLLGAILVVVAVVNIMTGGNPNLSCAVSFVGVLVCALASTFIEKLWEKSRTNRLY